MNDTETAGRLEELYSTTKARVVDATSWRPSSSTTAGVIGAIVYAGPVRAQTGAGGAEDMMCGTGVGQLLSVAIVLAATYLLVKGFFRVLGGADKLGSARSEQKREGKEQIAGGAKTAVIGIVGPGVFAGVLEVLGVSTLSCINLGAGIMTVGAFPF